jgi:hypothetical protein
MFQLTEKKFTGRGISIKIGGKYPFAELNKIIKIYLTLFH